MGRVGAGHMKGGGARYYVLAGILVGFAAATKYVGGVALLSLISAHVLREDERTNGLSSICFSVLPPPLVPFVVANPPLVFASCEFFEGFVLDNAYNTTVGRDTATNSLFLIMNALSQSVGRFVGLIAVLAFVYSAIRCFTERTETRQLFFVMLSLAAYFAVIGNISYASTRHVMPMTPLLLILLGKMIADLTMAVDRHRPRRWLGYALLCAVLIVASLRVLSAELQITFDPSVEGLAARSPDLLVVSSAHYGRYFNDPSGPDGMFFRDLFESGNFEVVAEFHYQLLPWFDPMVEFINPTIRIYRQRSADSH